MALTVVTGMWGPRRDEYARQFLGAFNRFWPGDVRLHVYADPPDERLGPDFLKVMSNPRQVRISWLKGANGWADFMRRHQGDPVKWGRQPAPGARWKEAALRKGYHFAFDACRFAGQAFIPEDAAKSMDDGDVLCWLDADVAAHRHVPEDLIEDLIGALDGAYLGREPRHSEIGFWAVRLSPTTRLLLDEFAQLYRTDQIFDLREWHSAFVWDEARRLCEKLNLRMRNLTPGGSGSVFDVSPLARYLEHRKGARKGFIT